MSFIPNVNHNACPKLLEYGTINYYHFEHTQLPVDVRAKADSSVRNR